MIVEEFQGRRQHQRLFDHRFTDDDGDIGHHQRIARLLRQFDRARAIQEAPAFP